jgi:acyl-CoA synthetase (AMP-forming)/AMP-acid ligase II
VIDTGSRWPTLRTRPEHERLRDEWRTLGYWTDERLGGILERSAGNWPDRVAVLTTTGSHTFSELQTESSAVARTLLDAGVMPGDVVCWMLPTGPDAIAVSSAIWRIGAVSSPIVPLSGVREMTNIIDQVRPRAIVVTPEHRGRSLPDEFDEAIASVGLTSVARLAVGSGPVGWTSATASGPGSIPAGVQPSAPEDPCLILFTSGTESAAKAVLHSAAGIHHELRTTIAEWGITFRDRMFMASPLTHITGLLQGFLIPARVGASAVLMDRWNGEEGMELIERTGATYMAGAAPFLRELLQAYRSSGLERSTLVQYCCGGAAVAPDLITGIAEFGVAGYRAWGMTELPTSTFANELDPLDLRSSADGRLAPGVDVRVLDDEGRPLPHGESGELQLRGPEMMLGYVKPEHNASAFSEDGWFRTGDIGTCDAAGWIRITGRSKEIINRGGEKFSTREIEDAIAKHPDVTAVAVVGVPGGRLGEQIGAVIVTRRDLSLEEIGRVVTSAGLSKHKQPERLVTVDAIPTNPTGKTDRRQTIALFDETV